MGLLSFFNRLFTDDEQNYKSESKTKKSSSNSFESWYFNQSSDWHHINYITAQNNYIIFKKICVEFDEYMKLYNIGHNNCNCKLIGSESNEVMKIEENELYAQAKISPESLYLRTLFSYIYGYYRIEYIEKVLFLKAQNIIEETSEYFRQEIVHIIRNLDLLIGALELKYDYEQKHKEDPENQHYYMATVEHKSINISYEDLSLLKKFRLELIQRINNNLFQDREKLILKEDEFTITSQYLNSNIRESDWTYGKIPIIPKQRYYMNGCYLGIVKKEFYGNAQKDYFIWMNLEKVEEKLMENTDYQYLRINGTKYGYLSIFDMRLEENYVNKYMKLDSPQVSYKESESFFGFIENMSLSEIKTKVEEIKESLDKEKTIAYLKSFEEMETEKEKYYMDLYLELISKIDNAMNYDRKCQGSGVYAICFNGSTKYYIGSTVDLLKRKNQHIWLLRHGIHHSYKLQNEYNQLGEDKLVFYVLETIMPEQGEENISNLLKITERKYFLKFKPRLNVEDDPFSRRHYRN